jgi:adenylate cyclase
VNRWGFCDGILAPPKLQADHADRACRAALAMRSAIAAGKAVRGSEGKAPARLRVGIHTGSAVVGNIGPSERINYTVVGDTANFAQRCEPHPSGVTILLSSRNPFGPQ